MSYVNDNESIHRQVEAIQTLNQAFIRSNGLLRIKLINGRTVEGRYYGLQCSANSTSKVCCNVTLGREDAENLGTYDVLEIVAVEPVASN
jgi:hypothetical protein